MSATLVHGTAIVVGGTGLIFVGPSGAGKSSLALQMLHSARVAGHFAALVSDDQVFLEGSANGVSAHRPDTIAGLIELRGSGIGRVESVASSPIHYAIELITVTAENRIPEENQRWTAGHGIELPLLCMDRLVRDPFPVLCALIDGFPSAPSHSHTE